MLSTAKYTGVEGLIPAGMYTPSFSAAFLSTEFAIAVSSLRAFHMK